MEKRDHEFAIVVAHPDDEILFASSIIEKATKIFVCFSDIPGESSINIRQTKGRKNVQKRYPMDNITFLDLPQASNKNALNINWDKVVENQYGVEGGRNEKEYKQNFQKLFNILSIELADFKKVYTHNPWGEYGHVEHIQIHRCITKLRKIIGFEMFVFGYLSRDTIKMANLKLRTLGTLSLKKNNKELFNKIKNLYIDEKCWTWSDYHTPPDYELFYNFKGINKSTKKSKLLKRKLIYIYHPIYSRRIRCCVYDSRSILFKIFMLQNKYLFRLRTFILNLFLRSLIKKTAYYKKCILPQ